MMAGGTPGRLVRAPFEVWLAPAADRLLGDTLRAGLGPSASVRSSLLVSEPRDPAVLVLLPEDLTGVHRTMLLRQSEWAHPARPVLYTGARNRDVLLDAINVWHVGRVVPELTPHEVLFDAVRKSYESMQAELALGQAASDLQAETVRLDDAVQTLEGARGQLLHTERLTTMGRIAGGLIVSIRQNLRTLGAFREVAHHFSDEEDLAVLLEHTFESITSIASLLDEFQGYAENRAQSYTFAEEDLDALVGRVLAFQRYDKGTRDRDIRQRLDSGARVRVDRHRMVQVLINLIRNAVHATVAGDHIEVQTTTWGDSAVITVMDTGCGMAPDVLAHAFEPFFTTKGENGMGMGLSMCRVIVDRHRGTIECESTPGRGTRIHVRLPRVSHGG